MFTGLIETVGAVKALSRATGSAVLRVDAGRIAVEGRGDADPVASNDTRDGRAQNRRAVVILRIE